MKLRIRRSYLYLFGLLLLGLVPRFLLLSRLIQYDEAFTFLTLILDKPFGYILSHYNFPNNHVFHTLCVYPFCKLFPGSTMAFRFVSFSAGLAIVVAGYIFFLRFYRSRYVAFAATVFLASSSVIIEYSSLARGYSLLVLFSLLAFYALLEASRTGMKKWWCLFMLFIALDFYTIPVALYAFLGMAVWFICSSYIEKHSADRERLLKNFFLYSSAGGFLIFLLYLPIILNAGPAALFANRFVSPQPLLSVLGQLPSFAAQLWREWNTPLPLSIAVIFNFLIFLGVFGYKKFRKKNIIIFLAQAIAFFSVTLSISRLPFTRCLLFLMPFYCGFAGCGFVYFVKRLKPTAFYPLTFACAILLNLLIVCYPPGEEKVLKSSPDIARTITSIISRSDSIAYYFPAHVLLGYYFYSHHIPLDNFSVDPAKARRMFFVLRRVEEAAGFGVFRDYDDFLKKSKISCKKISFSDADLYILRQ